MSAWPFYLAYLMPASAVAGYLLGGIFSLIPPLWRKVMDPRVQKVREQLAN